MHMLMCACWNCSSLLPLLLLLLPRDHHVVHDAPLLLLSPAGARDTYVALLRGIIGCSGPQPDAELADGSAMALASTSPQYLEYGPFQDLRNSMIQVSEGV
jgi:hypothetical protein